MIIFDLDGTLSIVGDRVKYLKKDLPNWDAFYEACDEDKLNEPIAHLYKLLYDIKGVYIVTGRRESVRQKTVKWLHNHHLIIDRLIMRPDGDLRHDTILKPELIEPFKDQIDVIFEDRSSMVKKWRELGYTCLQVAEGDF